MTTLQTETITIQVTLEAARASREVSDEDRKKLELLLSIQLLEAMKTREALKDVMYEISQNAQKRGLTPAIWKSFWLRNEMRVVFDTNVVVSALLISHSRHERAFYKALEQDEILIWMCFK